METCSVTLTFEATIPLKQLFILRHYGPGILLTLHDLMRNYKTWMMLDLNQVYQIFKMRPGEIEQGPFN